MKLGRTRWLHVKRSHKDLREVDPTKRKTETWKPQKVTWHDWPVAPSNGDVWRNGGLNFVNIK